MSGTKQFDEIIKILNSIFIDVLEDDKIILKSETSSMDIDEWDSLNHIALVVAIENKLIIQFTAKEIQDFRNVGEMCECIALKLQSKA